MYDTVVLPVNPYSNVMSPAVIVESTLLTVTFAVFSVELWLSSGIVVTVSVYVPAGRLDTVIDLPFISTGWIL